MNRLASHLHSGFVLAGFGLLLSGTSSYTLAQGAGKKRDQPNAKAPLDGAWRLVSVKDPAGQMRQLPAGVEMTKLLVGGRYAWTVVQNGRAVAGAGGSYAVANDTYTETVTYIVGERQPPMVGKSFKFTWKFEGGRWQHKGVLDVGTARQEIDEIWERIP
ncbi:MAG: hypothetical protein ACLQIB_12030 [Isosphaeraceae bacterium]